MGMYDTILVACPKCGNEENFQTKGGDCLLSVWKLAEAPQDALSDVNRHSPATCSKCAAVFEVELRATVMPVLVANAEHTDGHHESKS